MGARVDDLLVFRARCCNPIRGEKIVGYITRARACQCTRPTAPTSSTCSTTRPRIEWSGTRAAPARRPYVVRLTLDVTDRKGILADVSSRVAGVNTNIKTLEATTDELEGASR